MHLIYSSLMNCEQTFAESLTNPKNGGAGLFISHWQFIKIIASYRLLVAERNTFCIAERISSDFKRVQVGIIQA